MKLRFSSILFRAAVLVGPLSTALSISTAAAQDSQRWMNQFGTRAALMGGAVTGGAKESSATYYNPGALGFLDDKSISVSANALRYESIQRDNVIADGVSLDSNDTTVIPLMVSGVLIPEESPEYVIGYSLSTVNSSSFNATERLQGVADIVDFPTFPGEEETIAQTSQSNNLNEYWGGLGLGYRLSDSIGIGFTNFLALRNQDASSVNQVRAVNQNTLGLSTLDTTESYDYWNLRALWKVGMQGKFDGIRTGLTVTTPSANITGDGTSFRDYTLNNFPIEGRGPVSFVASDRQDDLDAEYRSPLSVGWGAEIDATSTTRVGTAVEWFTGQGTYTVLDAEDRPFLLPQGANAGLEGTQFLRVVDAQDNIVNFAVAVEQDLNDKWTGYAAFRSDYNTHQPLGENDQQISWSSYDIWHATVGATYLMERSTLALGVEYSWGDSKDPIQDTQEVKNDYSAVSVILGYTYHFGDIVPKKS